MIILGFHSGHDAAAAIFKDYELVAFVKEERMTRKKSDGHKIPFDSIKECLKIAGLNRLDVDVVSISKAHLPIEYYKKTSRWQDNVNKLIGISKVRILATEMYKQDVYDVLELLDLDYMKKDLGLRDDVVFDFVNHHYSHMLGAFYYTQWSDKSLYVTADGGGDGIFYSAYYFDGKSLIEIYGGDKYIYNHEKNYASLGHAYSYVTEILGFTPNKHEGKITGLAALGEPVFKDKIVEQFIITDNGKIDSKLESEKALYELLNSMKENTSAENLAASIQVATEEVLLKWITSLMKSFEVEYIGMSGGVFANVRLNQKVAEMKGINDVFIFPPMGDEGLSVGNIIAFLEKNKGLETVINNRKNMKIPYFGRKYSNEKILNEIPEGMIVYKENDYIEKAALLLKKYVGAIFFAGMEAGPRALGARSMIASPADRSINDSLNQRLNRTEFMPFAPYVRDVDARKVFKIEDSMYNACKFMTITTDVYEQYVDLIPAVVHVDKTARPQIISRDDNYLYYDILTAFQNLTQLPVLINTSFNAHEEPIINTPKEAFQSLLDDRIDFLIFENFLVLPNKLGVELS